MKLRLAGALALAIVTSVSGLAASQEDEDEIETPHFLRPHWWRGSFRVSTVYYPDADNGLAPLGNLYDTNAAGALVPVNRGPFEAVFGTRHRLLTEGELERDLWQGFGSVGVGAGVSYAEFYGIGFHQEGGPGGIFIRSSDGTGFHLVTAKLFVTYRFDYFVPDGFPLVPYVKGGLDWVVYWEQLSSGEITPGVNGSAIGLVTGLEGTAGLSFMLDWIDPQIARDMYIDLGIAHSFLTAGWTWQDIQNDPSNLIHKVFNNGQSGPKTLDLSASFFNFGVELEF